MITELLIKIDTKNVFKQVLQRAKTQKEKRTYFPKSKVIIHHK